MHGVFHIPHQHWLFAIFWLAHQNKMAIVVYQLGIVLNYLGQKEQKDQYF
jgi:hypothetical protein